MPVKLVNNTEKIKKKIIDDLDLVLSAMAIDVLRLSKRQVPVAKKGGQLQSSGIIEHPKQLTYKISYNKKYAAYQHIGQRLDGSRVVENYTYPGKKSKYLSDPGKQVFKNRDNYLRRIMKWQ